ncbi:MAG: T9SS type A sorting domain-containing protein, partial [Bacteroidota bacterium]
LALPPPDPNLSTLSGNTQYIIYPNPARDKVTIKSAEIPIQNRLILLNFNGQEILRKEISDQKTTININMLPSGVYLLKLISNKAVETRKLLKE